MVKTVENSHVLLKSILRIAQLSGLFPVDNLRHPTPDLLKFRWISWKVLYSITVCFSALFCGVVGLVKAFDFENIISHLIPPLFHLCSCCIILSFISISKNWGPFIQSLTNLEEGLLTKYNCPVDLKKRLKWMFFIIYGPALCEQIGAIIKHIYSYTCESNSSNVEQYFKKQYHYIFYFFPYSHFASIFLVIATYLGWVIWTFGDVFIIALSIIISNRFKQISEAVVLYLSAQNVNSAIHYSKHKPVYRTTDHVFFEQIREDYNQLALITKKLNRLLSTLIITCYTFNLSFILVQLFNSIQQMDTYIERIYFFYSFGFVIARTVIVSIYAASINEESKSFLPILNSIPTAVYCVEIQRLIIQIHGDSSALTGHNFFRITRGMVLNIAAAIITYELVLIQFNHDALDKYKSTSSSICV